MFRFRPDFAQLDKAFSAIWQILVCLIMAGRTDRLLQHWHFNYVDALNGYVEVIDKAKARFIQIRSCRFTSARMGSRLIFEFQSSSKFGSTKIPKQHLKISLYVSEQTNISLSFNSKRNADDSLNSYNLPLFKSRTTSQLLIFGSLQNVLDHELYPPL